jgi:hypothetical protein
MTFKELLFQGLGEASMCWSEIPSGVFNSTRAKEIGDEICAEHDKLRERCQKLEDALRFYADDKNYTDAGIIFDCYWIGDNQSRIPEQVQDYGTRARQALQDAEGEK